ncbi:MAG: hypothetical protein R3A10_21255 [Caldilineaceae bacterium]
MPPSSAFAAQALRDAPIPTLIRPGLVLYREDTLIIPERLKPRPPPPRHPRPRPQAMRLGTTEDGATDGTTDEAAAGGSAAEVELPACPRSSPTIGSHRHVAQHAGRTVDTLNAFLAACSARWPAASPLPISPATGCWTTWWWSTSTPRLTPPLETELLHLQRRCGRRSRQCYRRQRCHQRL